MSELEKTIKCRLCLNASNEVVSIFSVNNENTLLELIYKYLYLKIEPDDFYSTNICQSCSRNLQDFDNFYEFVQKCQFTLRAMQLSADKTTIDAEREILNVKTEAMQEFVEYNIFEISESVKVINEAESAIGEQSDENENINEHEIFSAVSNLKVENLSVDEDSIDCKEDIVHEGAVLTNDLTEISTLSSIKSNHCKNCGSGFESENMYDEHFEKTKCTKPAKNVSCAFCSKVFINDNQLKKHMRRFHESKRIGNRTGSTCANVDENDKIQFATDSSDENGEIQSATDSSDENDEFEIAADSSDENDDMRVAAEASIDGTIPAKSRNVYEKRFKQFCDWMKYMEKQEINETLLLAYFNSELKAVAPSTKWSIYSMLKAMIKITKNIDIGAYSKLLAFLKMKNKEYKPKNPSVLQREQIFQFIRDADDIDYLAIKVILIVGISGACKRHELTQLETRDVRDVGNGFSVTIRLTKTNSIRQFSICDSEDGIDVVGLVRKYISLRPPNTEHNRFFVQYYKGHCTRQGMGINKIGQCPKIIAQYLGLPNFKSFTGHCFRKTSAKMLADAGAKLTARKRHVVWKSSPVADGNVADSMAKKKKLMKPCRKRKHSKADFPISPVPFAAEDVTPVASTSKQARMLRSSNEKVEMLVPTPQTELTVMPPPVADTEIKNNTTIAANVGDLHSHNTNFGSLQFTGQSNNTVSAYLNTYIKTTLLSTNKFDLNNC